MRPSCVPVVSVTSHDKRACFCFLSGFDSVLISNRGLVAGSNGRKTIVDGSSVTGGYWRHRRHPIYPLISMLLLFTISPALRRATVFHGLTNKVESFFFLLVPLADSRNMPRAPLQGVQRASIPLLQRQISLGYVHSQVSVELEERNILCIIKDQSRDSRATVSVQKSDFPN
ncbi:hypothetical protein BKA81DRAFT_199112 [Phyllosticta paracitricarpa]